MKTEYSLTVQQAIVLQLVAGRTDCHLHATRVGFPDIGDVDAQFGRYPNMKNVPWHLVKGYPDVTEVSE